MIILAVDTTTPTGSAALLDKKRLLAEINVASAATYSERLLPAVDILVKTAGLKMNDVSGFALAVGPGSFTGIRIGISTVKSFSYASGKPVAPVSSLRALALKIQYPYQYLLCPVLDAKKGEVFAALFESKANRVREIIAQGAYSPEKFFSMLPSHRVINFIGNGVGAYKERIQEYFKDNARFSSRSCFIAHEVGLLGYETLKKGKGLTYNEIEPLYFRRSQAEEKD